MTLTEIIAYATERNVRMKVRAGKLVLEAHQQHDLPPGFIEAARRHKQALLEILEDLSEAREERAAILEYHHGYDQHAAEVEAISRVRFVTCEYCTHWTDMKQCSAGLNIGDETGPRAGIRICGFHTPKRRLS